MKSELVRFHNGVESIDKHKEPETERNATLKAGAKRRFQSGMECRRKRGKVADQTQGIA